MRTSKVIISNNSSSKIILKFKVSFHKAPYIYRVFRLNETAKWVSHQHNASIVRGTQARGRQSSGRNAIKRQGKVGGRSEEIRTDRKVEWDQRKAEVVGGGKEKAWLRGGKKAGRNKEEWGCYEEGRWGAEVKRTRDIDKGGGDQEIRGRETEVRARNWITNEGDRGIGKIDLGGAWEDKESWKEDRWAKGDYQKAQIRREKVRIFKEDSYRDFESSC